MNSDCLSRGTNHRALWGESMGYGQLRRRFFMDCLHSSFKAYNASGSIGAVIMARYFVHSAVSRGGLSFLEQPATSRAAKSIINRVASIVVLPSLLFLLVKVDCSSSLCALAVALQVVFARAIDNTLDIFRCPPIYIPRPQFLRAKKMEIDMLEDYFGFNVTEEQKRRLLAVQAALEVAKSSVGASTTFSGVKSQGDLKNVASEIGALADAIQDALEEDEAEEE
ncbi:Uncharacterised protein [Serratia rubidaea]|uniref:Uncharacterized protein n=1 Tax=Serratia rubidaea TaxID=61652 RepID=A0A447QEW2_SERRU|nr:Uncharacterised protein [Serratia rubidaea]